MTTSTSMETILLVLLQISASVISLKCWVGHHSQKVSKMQLMECSEASSWSIPKLDMTFGDWSGSHLSSWACAKIPHLGSVTKDCVLEENLPEWWDRMCNGAVCYCNDKDGCNAATLLPFQSGPMNLYFIFIYIMIL